MSTRKTRVLFVCMGNICRSPTAEGVFRGIVDRAGLADRFDIDSAGTHDYHIGDAPDARAQAAALRRGYDLSPLRARQVDSGDFSTFDFVLAMDRNNLALLQQRCPAEHRRKVRMLLDFAESGLPPEVPDPYYGSAQGFEQVLDLIEAGARGLLQHIRNNQ
jgi:protein-tyrosine phosphatase